MSDFGQKCAKLARALMLHETDSEVIKAASEVEKAGNQLQHENAELVEALGGYDQIVRVAINSLERNHANEIAKELREKLGDACELLAKHKESK